MSKELSEEITPADQRAFLQKDYELKIRYLSDHYSRMWTRCNFFVGLESALTIALLGWFKDRGAFARESGFIATIGVVLSLWWYCFGAQDRYLAEVYRKQIGILSEILSDAFELSDAASKGYTHVGDTQSKNARVPSSLYQWRINAISTTKLAVWFPVLSLIYWLVVLVIIKSK